MNIEEERKAFEKAIPLKEGLVWYPSHGSYMAWLPALNAHANRANGEFASWLKAKLHAQEMAKPVAEIYERMDDRYWAVKEGTRNNICENGSTFVCYADAHKLAVERGYRVIE